MRLSEEGLFYIILISVLSLIAILLPIVVMNGHKTPRRYIFLGNSANFTEWGKYTIVKGIPPELKYLEGLLHRSDGENDDLAKHNESSTESGDYEDDSGFTPPSELYGPNQPNETTSPKPDMEPQTPLRYMNTFMNMSSMTSYLDSFVNMHHIWFSKTKIGESTKNKFPIDLITVKKPNKPKPIVLVVGNSYYKDTNAALMVLALMNKLLENREKTYDYLDDFNFNFIPVLNPDDYEFAGTGAPVHTTGGGNRWNKTNYTDIVENFDPTKNKESAAFRDFIQNNGKNIAAVFFMFSMDSDKPTIAFPKNIAEQNSEKLTFFKDVLCKELVEKTPFKYWDGLSKDGNRIDEWLVKTMKPKDVLVIDFLEPEFKQESINTATFIDQYSETLRKIYVDIVLKTYQSHKEYMGL